MGSMSPKRASGRRLDASSIYQAGVAVPATGLLVWLLLQQQGSWTVDLVLWTAVVAGVELVRIPAWRGLQVSLGFPILLAVGMIYAPPLAALVAYVGSVDPREFRREVSLLMAMFNRSQVAMAVLAASSVFHAITSVHGDWAIVLPAALVAGLADYVVNVTLVGLGVAIGHHIRFL